MHRNAAPERGRDREKQTGGARYRNAAPDPPGAPEKRHAGKPRTPGKAVLGGKPPRKGMRGRIIPPGKSGQASAPPSVPPPGKAGRGRSLAERRGRARSRSGGERAEAPALQGGGTLRQVVFAVRAARRHGKAVSGIRERFVGRRLRFASCGEAGFCLCVTELARQSKEACFFLCVTELEAVDKGSAFRRAALWRSFDVGPCPPAAADRCFGLRRKGGVDGRDFRMFRRWSDAKARLRVAGLVQCPPYPL